MLNQILLKLAENFEPKEVMICYIPRYSSKISYLARPSWVKPLLFDNGYKADKFIGDIPSFPNRLSTCPPSCHFVSVKQHTIPTCTFYDIVNKSFNANPFIDSETGQSDEGKQIKNILLEL